MSSSADLLHGPIAAVKSGRPAIVIVPSGRTLASMAAAVADVRERGSEVMAISDDHEFLAAADTAFPLVPGVTPFAAWSDYAYYAFAPDGGFDHAPCKRIRSHRTHSSDSRSTFPGACPQFRQGRHTGFPRWGDLASGSRKSQQRADTAEMATSVATGSPLPESGALPSGADVDADALIERSRQLAATPLGDRDRLASLLLGGSFLTVAVALGVLAHSSRQAGFWTLVVFVASYALASRIDFEIGTGSAPPTQLVLVPMLALLPVQYVPLCVRPIPSKTMEKLARFGLVAQGCSPTASSV